MFEFELKQRREVTVINEIVAQLVGKPFDLL
jgi:hypothetical protein